MTWELKASYSRGHFQERMGFHGPNNSAQKKKKWNRAVKWREDPLPHFCVKLTGISCELLSSYEMSYYPVRIGCIMLWWPPAIPKGFCCCCSFVWLTVGPSFCCLAHYCGSPGVSGSPHLHFSTKVDGTACLGCCCPWAKEREVVIHNTDSLCQACASIPLAKEVRTPSLTSTGRRNIAIPLMR